MNLSAEERIQDWGPLKFVDQLGEAVFLAFPDGRIDYANPAAVALFGYSLEEFQQIGRDGIIDPENQDLRTALNERSEKGKFEGELIFRKKSGELFEARVSSQLFESENGVLRTTVIIHDISSKKQGEKKLLKSLEVMQAFVDNAINPIIILDENFQVIKSNEKYSALADKYQFDGNEAKSLFSFFDINPDEEIPQIFKDGFNGRVTHKTISGTSKNQKKYWFNISVNPIGNKDGEILAVSVAIEDHTATRKAEEEIKKSKADLNLLLNNTEEFFIILDKSLQIIEINKVTETRSQQIFGVPFKRGESILKYAMPDRLEALKNLYNGVLAGKKMQSEISIEHPGMDVYHLQLVYRPLTNENNEVEAIFITVQDVTQQKIALQKIEEGENKFKTIINNSSDGITLMDASGRVWEMSESSINATGWSLKDLLGEAREDINHPDDREIAAKLFVGALENPGVPTQGEYRIKKKNGATIWIEARFINMLETPGIRSMVMYYRDISERKMAEKQLEFSENRFRAMVQNGHDMIAILDEKAIYQYMSPTKKTLMGHDPENLVGKCAFDFIHPDDVEKVKDQYLALPKGGKNVLAPFRFPTTEGEWRWMFTTLTDMRENPAVGGIVANTRDITDQKEAEDHIKEAKEQLEWVMEATNDAIWDWNVTTGKVYWGKGFEKLFGYNLDEWSQLGIEDAMNMMHPDDYAKQQESFVKTAENIHQLQWNSEYRLKKSNGEYAHVLDRAIILRDEDGKPMRVIGAIQDISERKRYEEELLQLKEIMEQRAHELAISNQQLEHFAYVASHDLQEPLRMVSSFLDLIKKRYTGKLDEKGEQYIDIALDGAERMRNLIKDLLEYSRVGTKKQEWTTTSLEDILSYIKGVFNRQILDSDAIITSDPLPNVTGDKMQITQLFQNLISNALKYKGEKSPIIHIGVKENNHQYTFSISDNGIGIDPKYFEKIFMIFQRLHSRTEYSGTGIGLAMCKRIVELHGGKIWLESEPGKGTIFYFTIKK